MKATLIDGSVRPYAPCGALGAVALLSVEFDAEDFEHEHIFEWIKEVVFLRLVPKRIIENNG